MQKLNGKGIVGVGFVLFNSEGRVFAIKELKSKLQYSKKAGMISFPIETQKPWDGSDTETVIRLIKEEMDPRLINYITGYHQDVSIFCPIPGRPEIIIRYHFGFLINGAPKDINIPDPDVEFQGWLTMGQLLEANPRVEVQPIFNHILKEHGNILKEKTRLILACAK